METPPQPKFSHRAQRVKHTVTKEDLKTCGICLEPISSRSTYRGPGGHVNHEMCARRCVVHMNCLTSEGAICQKCICIRCGYGGAQKIYMCDCAWHTDCLIITPQVNGSVKDASLNCFWCQPLTPGEVLTDRYEYAREVSRQLQSCVVSFTASRLTGPGALRLTSTMHPAFKIYFSDVCLSDLVKTGVTLEDMAEWFSMEEFISRFFEVQTISSSLVLRRIPDNEKKSEENPDGEEEIVGCTYNHLFTAFGGRLGTAELAESRPGVRRSPVIKGVPEKLAPGQECMRVVHLLQLKATFVELLDRGLTADQVLDWGSPLEWSQITGFDIEKVHDWRGRATKLAAAGFLENEKALQIQKEIQSERRERRGKTVLGSLHNRFMAPAEVKIVVPEPEPEPEPEPTFEEMSKAMPLSVSYEALLEMKKNSYSPLIADLLLSQPLQPGIFDLPGLAKPVYPLVDAVPPQPQPVKTEPKQTQAPPQKLGVLSTLASWYDIDNMDKKK